MKRIYRILSFKKKGGKKGDGQTEKPKQRRFLLRIAKMLFELQCGLFGRTRKKSGRSQKKAGKKSA
jgi:hypothetical protein